VVHGTSVNPSLRKERERLGHPPEFEDENLREVIAYSYRIIYRVEAAEIIIAAVIHGKRNLESE
jgi:plasmid stabilization system protein ParE